MLKAVSQIPWFPEELHFPAGLLSKIQRYTWHSLTDSNSFLMAAQLGEFRGLPACPTPRTRGPTHQTRVLEQGRLARLWKARAPPPAHLPTGAQASVSEPHLPFLPTRRTWSQRPQLTKSVTKPVCVSLTEGDRPRPAAAWGAQTHGKREP